MTLTIIPRPTVGGYESDIFSAYRIASTRNTKRNERQLYRHGNFVRRSVCPSIKVTVAEDRELQLNGGAKVATEHSIKNHTQDRGPH